MNIQTSTELTIFVTHVEAKDSLLKIWGQVDKNSATCVERMILPLAEQFARSQDCLGSRPANLRLNALCCARFQNEGYYRAKVINVRPDGMVVLQFIDYGNIEVLPPQEVHLLESVPGAEPLQSLPPVAFEFALANVLPINEIWENKIIELIKKSLCYNEYTILIHSIINNHRFIKLWYNNEDFSELLIKRQMALGTPVQEMFRPLTCRREPQAPQVYQQSGNHLISNSCTSIGPIQNINPLQCDGNNMRGYQRNIPPCCTAQQKHMMQSSVQEALVFKSRVLDVPSQHEIYVSFVEDGPHKFSVQLQSTSQILSALMRDINSHPIDPLQEPPLPGSVCLGRYTRDKVLCRAVVMSVMENKCKLYYVDFGHTEVLPYTDIFQLPSHFINPKVLSIRFTLSGVHELNVREEMKEYFKQIVSGKLLVLHVCPPEGPPLVQYGDLYDDGKNIKNILRQAFPTPTVSPISFGYREPMKLSKGAEEVVHVSFVQSCRKFFVQLDSSAGSLESVMNCLTEFCQTAPTLSLTQLKIGLPCAALYDNQWYRAQILGINAANVKILYVDYGNEETVAAAHLRFIHEDLIKRLEAQAIQCTLHGWELFTPSQEVSNRFELLTLEKRLLLRVVDTKPDCLLVDLYEPERMESIKNQMLQTSGDERKAPNESSYQNTEKQRGTNISSNINQSENINNWQRKSQIDTWNEAPSTNVIQEKHKSKSWKDKSNEENLYENRNEKSTFHRNDSRKDRSNNKEEFSNARNVKDKWSNRNEYNDSLKSSRDGGRGGKGGRNNKTSGHSSKSHSADKSWSDKDSDTSSRGSGRRGRGSSTRGSHSKRDGCSGKTQNSRFSDADSTKSGKSNSDSYHGNNKSKDRKGQGYRLTQYKSAAANSNNMEEERQNKNEFRIPAPNIVIGSTKNCEVVFTNGPLDFYIQFSPDYTALDSMMESIASIYENGSESVRESKIFNGLYCIAQYSEDSRWYRAVVKSIERDNATVQFLDYGNTETVILDKIKVIQKEFLKLPIQAVHCKLFGLESSDDIAAKTFEDKVNGILLEVEFVTEENDVYGVMLREVVDGRLTEASINGEFCIGVNLQQAKEAALFRFKPSPNAKEPARPDYAPLDAVWSTVSHKPETKKDVIVTWFTNSNNFYCQILENENEFKTIMNKIQRVYAGREPVSYTLKIGSPVIATFSEDKALYRAEIVELNKCNGHLIHYIDFGNNAVVDFRNIYPVEKEFMRLPKQSFQCSLLNIVPKDGRSWSNVDTKAVDNCFNGDKYTCTFHSIEDNKYLVSLDNNGKDVADILVEKNLASFASKAKSDDVADDSKTIAPTISNEIERVDINLLSGQTLKVKVSSVENVSKFHVQLPFAAKCENLINTYMNTTKVMQRLSAHEICLGTGCLVCSNGIWRRAVICNRSQSAGLDVKFIDTGAYDEILSDRVLALPGELSVMQNQALECSLMNVTRSPEADSTLKKSVEGKEIIMYIDQVDNNRLIVKLFDTLGKAIRISEDTSEETSPICPMPILSSTHKVLVSYADHSSSIWLQRNVEFDLDRNLSEALAKYYPANGKLVKPSVGLLCAAKAADGAWYRGRVITCTETNACINFIDYGNNEEVTNDVIMTLDPCFYVPHQLSINVSLPITLGGTASEQINILQEYLSNKEFTAVFRNINKRWTVELLFDGEKISEKLAALNLPQQEVSKAIDVHSMEVGRRYDVSVSHVDSLSQFWLQSTEDASNLSKKQSELQEQAPTFPEVQGILEEGSLCVAMYTITNLWYRAEVLDADEDITTVRFIDYGNADVIDNKSGKIRQIPDSWKEMKEHVVKCRLDVIATDSEGCNTAASERFESLISAVESLQALVIANGVPKRVDLFANGQSVSDTLVKENLAVRIHTEEDLIDEIVDLELDPHSAFVSHVDSPSEFWVQEEKSVGDLEVMTDRFIMADMFPTVDKIEENMLCVAKYPADDCWYRARVMSHSENATQVLYIDYGNSATSTEIRAIPEDLMNVPPLSRKCRLVMPEGITEWSEQACEEFVKLAAYGATIFLLDVLNDDHDENDTSLVKLTLIDENVTDLLAKFCQRSYPPIIEERLPPLGEENSPNVFITRINSLDEFYVQSESSTADLNMVLNRLEAAEDFLPLNTFEDGTVCAAMFPDDGLWYRAKILSDSGDPATVFFIDYGNTAVTNAVRTLPVDIANVPALSRCCALQKPETITSWPSEALKTFGELYNDGETMFQLEILDDSCDPISVRLTLDGKNIVDTLVPSSEEPPPPYDEAAVLQVEETAEKSTVDQSEGQIEDAGEEGTANLPCNSSVELTVDEIVQNMERNVADETEEEVGTFNTEEKDNEATIQEQQSHSSDQETSETITDLVEVNQREDVQAVKVVDESESIDKESVTPISVDTTILKNDDGVNKENVHDLQEEKQIAESDVVTDSEEKINTVEDNVHDHQEDKQITEIDLVTDSQLKTDIAEDVHNLQEEKQIAESDVVTDSEEKVNTVEDNVHDLQEDKPNAEIDAVTDSQIKTDIVEDVYNLQEEKQIAKSDVVTNSEEKINTVEDNVHDLQEDKQITETDLVTDSQLKTDIVEDVHNLQEEKQIAKSDVVTNSEEKTNTVEDNVHDLQEDKPNTEIDAVTDSQLKTDIVEDVHNLQEEKQIAKSDVVTNSEEKINTVEDNVHDLQEDKQITETVLVTDSQLKTDIVEDVHNLQEEKQIAKSDVVTNSEEKINTVEDNVHDLQEDKQITEIDLVTDSQLKTDIAEDVHNLQEEKQIAKSDVVTDSEEKINTVEDNVHDLQEDKPNTEIDLVTDSQLKTDIVEDVYNLQEEKQIAKSDVVTDSEEKINTVEDNVHDLQEEKQAVIDVVTDSQLKTDIVEDVNDLQEDKPNAEIDVVTDSQLKIDIVEGVHDLQEETNAEIDVVSDSQEKRGNNKTVTCEPTTTISVEKKEATDMQTEVNSGESKKQAKEEMDVSITDAKSKETVDTECKIIEEEDKNSAASSNVRETNDVENIVESKDVSKTSE